MQDNQDSTDFVNGLHAGQENLSKDIFEDLIEKNSNLQWFEEQLRIKNDELSTIDEKIAIGKKITEEKFQVHAQENHFSQIKKNDLDLVDSKISNLNLRLEKTSEKYDKSFSPYSLIVGVIYLIAGIAFVLGDLIISHEIVAYALNIRNYYEAWAFAFGLAMLSVLLKPAYDRLIEQPYLTEKTSQTHKRYAIFQSILMVAALGTMFILGWFRYESYRTDQLKKGLNEQIKQIQNQATPLDPTVGLNPQQNTAINSQLKDKLTQYDALNVDLVNSPWALASFVLSGLLFAVAGAICLGIAFPILQAYWFRWVQAGPEKNRLRKRIEKANLERIDIYKTWAEQDAKTIVAANELTNASLYLDLLPERAQIIKRLDEIFEQLKTLKIESRQSNFGDGFERGKALASSMTDQEAEEWRLNILEQFKKQSKNKIDESNERRVHRTPTGLRPHEMLRKVIAKDILEN